MMAFVYYIQKLVIILVRAPSESILFLSRRINMDFTVNKLIVLYLLSEIKLPLTLSQLTQMVLERGDADYFSIQEYLNQLISSKLIVNH